MQQLSLLEEPPPGDAAMVWTLLEEEQRIGVVTKLARLMAKTITPTPGRNRDERAEQDHQ